MNQMKADALLKSIATYASLASESNFTLHASEGVHMSKELAKARALEDTSKLCGYFQHDQMDIITKTKDDDGWDIPKKQQVKTFAANGISEDVSTVEYMRLIKAFFRDNTVTASPGSDDKIANMKGPIPANFTGYTNAIGTDTYTQVHNMKVVILSVTNWQLVTIYPVA